MMDIIYNRCRKLLIVLEDVVLGPNEIQGFGDKDPTRHRQTGTQNAGNHRRPSRPLACILAVFSLFPSSTSPPAAASCNIKQTFIHVEREHPFLVARKTGPGMTATDNRQDQGEQETSRPRYEVGYHMTSDRDDDAMFKVRRNGKAFYIHAFPLQFVNSPSTTEKYLSYLESFFAKLAPFSVLPLRREDLRVTLRDHSEPEWFIFNLGVVDEELGPRRVEMERSLYIGSSRVWLDDDFLDDLFNDPKDALSKPPRKVLIDNEKTAYSFKPCDSPESTMAELNAYKKTAAAGLASRLRLCPLYAIVMNDAGFVAGMLLTYIDGRSLSTQVDPDYPSASVKERWAGQLDSTLAELRKAGVVWGNVKAENVLVDQDDNAWIIDLRGGYTRGWVDWGVAGTIEGDLAGMAKLREFIFMKEGQVRWRTGHEAESNI
ncbi:hypothetical protein F5B21DRAFT_507905 [Xylaria acuta]|nr:hypothetical protein F5B21DRAFT_507905 [Xylaria acuta]